MIRSKAKKPDLTEDNINCILKIIFTSKNLHGSDLEQMVKTTKVLQETLRIVKEEKYR